MALGIGPNPLAERRRPLDALAGRFDSPVCGSDEYPRPLTPVGRCCMTLAFRLEINADPATSDRLQMTDVRVSDRMLRTGHHPLQLSACVTWSLQCPSS